MRPLSSSPPAAEGVLAGRVALVTGAGGGIGRAVALRLASAGAQLALTDLRADALSETASLLPDALAWTGDLTREAEVAELFRLIHERYGRLDIAVHAAGLLRVVPFEEISKAEWDRVVDANLGSAFLVCRECCEPMRRQGWGRVITFSSIAGQTGGILSGAHYAASKAAIISLTRSLAKHLAPHGVRCNAIAPSGVATEMLDAFTEAQREALRQGIPVGRLGNVEEVAELVCWLASPAADFITGQTININGGAYLG